MTRVNPFMPSGLFCLYHRTSSFPTQGVSGLLLVLSFIIEILVFNANSVDPDQMLQNAASDLGLHCSPMSFFGDAGYKRVKSFHTCCSQFIFILFFRF